MDKTMTAMGQLVQVSACMTHLGHINPPSEKLVHIFRALLECERGAKAEDNLI